MLESKTRRLDRTLSDFKTTLGMEQLHCKTPDMAEKELLAYPVAHNPIRCAMAKAVARAEMALERISFKGRPCNYRGLNQGPPRTDRDSQPFSSPSNQDLGPEGKVDKSSTTGISDTGQGPGFNKDNILSWDF